jgi:hypothetical protein
MFTDEMVRNSLCLQILLLYVFVPCEGVLAIAGGPLIPCSTTALSNASPLGVKVEQVVRTLFLASRLEDGSNFKLICLRYVICMIRRLVVRPGGGRSLLVVSILASCSVRMWLIMALASCWSAAAADDVSAPGPISGRSRLSRLSVARIWDCI